MLEGMPKGARMPERKQMLNGAFYSMPHTDSFLVSIVLVGIVGGGAKFRFSITNRYILCSA